MAAGFVYFLSSRPFQSQFTANNVLLNLIAASDVTSATADVIHLTNCWCLLTLIFRLKTCDLFSNLVIRAMTGVKVLCLLVCFGPWKRKAWFCTLNEFHI